jgi:Hemerythrin HHE cation binding domain
LIACIEDPLSDTETEQGKALFDELLWVHGVIRRDLNTVQRLAEAVLAGLDPLDLQHELQRLETTGPLWQLKVNCLRWCRFVHGHHDFEDTAWLPSLRRADPALGPVVERIDEEHRRISDQLDEVAAAATALTETDDGHARGRVVDALNSLSGDLIEHLAYEELSLGPTLRRMRRL